MKLEKSFSDSRKQGLRIPEKRKSGRIIKIMKRWWHSKKDAVRTIRDWDLSKDDVASLKKLDRESRVKHFSKLQDERKSELLSTGIDISKMVPTIGNEIRWLDIIEMAFRVLEFDRNDTTLDLDKGPEKVKAKSEIEPYGFLLVKSPTLNQPVRLPIIHNNDFWLAGSVFDDPDVYRFIENGERELLVTYAPKKINKHGFAISPHHVLHYVIVPSGTLE